MTPQPPVELTCATKAGALLSQQRLAHNAFMVATLTSQNATRPGVHAQAPNVSRARAIGGSEVQTMQGLQAQIDEKEVRHALAAPDSAEREMYARQLERMDRHMQDLRDQLAALDTGPRVRPGLRDTYRVKVPALHARVQGVMYVADAVTLEVQVDPNTPGYAEYLGRQQHPGHGGTGPWPLWRPYKAGMKAASEAQDWHFVLAAQLWPFPALPELREVAPELTEEEGQPCEAS